jgi:hypothetical protein
MTNYTSRPPPMTREEKLKERWLRRVVARQGYRLRKQRRWDVGAYDYGRYRIFGPDDQLAAGDEIFGMTLDEVEDWAFPNADRQASNKQLNTPSQANNPTQNIKQI